MSKKINLDEKRNNKFNPNHEDLEIPNENTRFKNNINIPKSSGSNSNDISKLNMSYLSSKNIDIESKANSDKKNLRSKINLENSDILYLDHEIEYIINKDREDVKRESNFFSEKALFDEINNVERDSNNNEKYDLN